MKHTAGIVLSSVCLVVTPCILWSCGDETSSVPKVFDSALVEGTYASRLSGEPGELFIEFIGDDLIEIDLSSVSGQFEFGKIQARIGAQTSTLSRYGIVLDVLSDLDTLQTNAIYYVQPVGQDNGMYVPSTISTCEQDLCMIDFVLALRTKDGVSPPRDYEILARK